MELNDRDAEIDLLRRARDGDANAFGELVTLHRQKITMQAYMIVRNQEDAFDLAQETFLRAWKNLHRFDGTHSMASWLRKIVTNAAIDLCRAKGHRPQSELPEGTLHADPASRTTPSSPAAPNKALENKELGARIEQAFEMLTLEHRAVISLKEFEGLSYQEIAEATGTSVGTVMSRLFYARQKLQSLLADLRHE